ncbi:hypothetical protein SRHO_G00270810 [Serrasalmus rhombeus]
MGRPFPLPCRQKTALGGTADLDVRRSEYTAGLLTVLNEYWERVNQTITDPPKVPTHAFKPGDQVLVKKFERKGFSDSPFSEPTTVLAVTRTGVLTDLFPQWIHASRWMSPTAALELQKLRGKVELMEQKIKMLEQVNSDLKDDKKFLLSQIKSSAPQLKRQTIQTSSDDELSTSSYTSSSSEEVPKKKKSSRGCDNESLQLGNSRTRSK